MSTHDDNDHAGDGALRDLIRAGAARYEAPPALRARIGRTLRQQEQPRRSEWRHWTGFGAAFASGILVSWLAGLLQPAADSSALIENEIVSAHVRAMMPGHAADVASSDQHTVKPWLSARLDFSPPVHDLRADGFPLIGGRLDYVGERTVAALVYQRNAHIVDVFVWPAREPGTAAPSAAARNGFNSLSWAQGGLRYWVISDLAAGELNAFAERLRQHNAEPS